LYLAIIFKRTKKPTAWYAIGFGFLKINLSYPFPDFFQTKTDRIDPPEIARIISILIGVCRHNCFLILFYQK